MGSPIDNATQPAHVLSSPPSLLMQSGDLIASTVWGVHAPRSGLHPNHLHWSMD